MTPVIVRRWNSTNSEPLTEAAVRSRFPADKYRVSTQRYPTYARFDGVTRKATCHVIAGMGRYNFSSDISTILRAGDVAELPAGMYSLEVLGDEPLVVVTCWELPFDFNHVQ